MIANQMQLVAWNAIYPKDEMAGLPDALQAGPEGWESMEPLLTSGERSAGDE